MELRPQLGIQSVRLPPESISGYGKLLKAPRKALDPNNVLHPAGIVRERR